MKLAYDDKQRFLVLENLAKPSGSASGSIEQKGKRGLDIDDQLTCADCENLFSVWEGYMRNALFGNGLHREPATSFDERTGLIRK